MSTILACTVGGSCTPIVTAIRDYVPAFLCFFVTTGPRGSRVIVDGKGHPCGENVPNILTQTGLSADKFEIIQVDEPDALSDCYSLMVSQLRRLATKYSGQRLIADYTGGTKTMGAALVLAALELNWEVSLVQGTRADLVRVLDGSEMASLVNAGEVRARQVLNEAQRLFDAFAYASAESVIEGVARAAPLSNVLQRTVNQMVALCRAFDAWDRFDHARARQLLAAYQSRCVAQWRFLKQLTGERTTGYEGVLDLIRNAERRASRGRYDDAIARLYRGLELFGQTRLQQRQPALDPSHLQVDLLPEHLRAQYESKRDPHTGKVLLGLRQNYELLFELDDPVGRVYASSASHLLSALTRRNNSILAHGTVPLTENDFREMLTLTRDFIEGALMGLKIHVDAPQFPRWSELAQ